MSADRELLDLAAEAAGILINGLYSDHHRPTSLPEGYLVILNASGGHSFWNPLDDDGDALRLAVKLRIDLEWQEDGGVEAYQLSGTGFCASEDTTMGYSIEEATRRAIVRAAAEIGRSLP